MSRLRDLLDRRMAQIEDMPSSVRNSPINQGSILDLERTIILVGRAIVSAIWKARY